MSSTAAPLHGTLRAAFRTDPGRVRTNNEDVPLVDADRGVFGVIDGVGGHAAGEIAAALACDVILQRLARPLGTPGERVREAIAIANNEIFRRAQESPELHGMTCVVTLAVVSDGTLTIGHVGDSRLYKLGGAGIRKLTRDHSPVGEREDAGEISESEAMRHPRRNEVFRDVGSGYRDKDESDYVDVIEEPMERDSAILMCTDGLTDMVPSPMIERIVRQQAGNPEAVVEALVAAANDAGGKDNVTVVYAETADFARAIRSGGGPAAAALPPGRPADVVPSAASTKAVQTPRRPNAIARGARWIVRSRTTWFALGAVAGVLAALGYLWWMAGIQPIASRTLIVAASGGREFSRIADAVSAARPGDTVQVEPGTYTERVFVGPGVNVSARVPGTVTLARDGGVQGEWVAMTAFGDEPARISGVRFESTAAQPIDVGLRFSGQGWTADMVEIHGPMRAGVELLPGASAIVQGSHIATPGTGVAMKSGSHVTLTGNVFVRVARSSAPPLAFIDPQQASLRRNVFSGFGADLVKGLSPGNIILPAEAPATR